MLGVHKEIFINRLNKMQSYFIESQSKILLHTTEYSAYILIIKWSSFIKKTFKTRTSISNITVTNANF